MHCCEVKPLPEPSSNAEVTSGSTSLVRPKLARTVHRKEVSSMLRLKINLRVRRSVRVKYPRHHSAPSHSRTRPDSLPPGRSWPTRCKTQDRSFHTNTLS